MSRRSLCCGGDGELTSEGRREAGAYAWCIACRGTGLADHSCAGCGGPTALDTVDRRALECIGAVVHADCDTGDAYFDHRPAPKLWRTA